MALFLALAAAASFGTGDFLGGLASRRVSTTSVVTWSYVISAGLLTGACALAGGTLTLRDVAIGTAGGLVGALGIGLLYRALAIGVMGAIAPVTALLAAAVPVAFGFSQGERPEAKVLMGMALGGLAVILISAEGGGSLRPSDMRGVGLALVAGFLFGAFFVLLSYTDDDSGLWPLLGARAGSVVVIGGLIVGGVLSAPRPRGASVRLVALTGLFDVTGNVFYLYAIREGLLSVVSVVSSLYPVATVGLAWLVLKERFETLQRFGLLLAIPATILMAA